MEIGGNFANGHTGPNGALPAVNPNAGVILPGLYTYATLPPLTGASCAYYWPGTMAYCTDVGYCYCTGTAWLIFGGGMGSGTVTSVTVQSAGNSIVVTGSPITVSGTINVDLPSQVSVVPGAYANANVTVNQDGIITNIAAGATGAVSSVALASTGGGALTVTGGGTGAVALTANLPVVNSNVGSFTSTNLTVDAYGRITAAGNGSGTGFGLSIYISSLTGAVGIYPNSATDSRAGLQTLLNTYAGTGTNLVLDCYLTLNIQGSNVYGAYMNPIFVPSGSILNGTTSGVLYTNALTAPTFIYAHCKNYQWSNITITSTAQVGTSTLIGSQFGPGLWGADPGNCNDITMQNYFITNFGNSYASGTHPYWNGPSIFLCTSLFRGQTYGKMTNCTWNVPPGTSAANFQQNPVCFVAEYCPGIAVNGSTTQFDNVAITFTGLLNAGATSGTLTSNWTTSTGSLSWQITFSTGETRVATMTANGTGVTWTGGLTYPEQPAAIAAQANTPGDCIFTGCVFDGYQMGVVDPAVVTFESCKWLRYAEMCDGTDNTITLSSTLAQGATTAQLSTSVYPTGFPYQTGLYALNMPGSGQVQWVNLTQGQTTASFGLGTVVYINSTTPSARSDGGCSSVATAAQLYTTWIGNSTNTVANQAKYTLSTGFTGTFPNNGLSHGSSTVNFASTFPGTTGVYAMVVSATYMPGGDLVWVSCTNSSAAATIVGGPTGGWTGTMTFSSGETRTVTISSSGAVSWTGALGGTSGVQIAPTALIPYGLVVAATSAVTVTGNQGAMYCSTAPPHMVYMNYSQGSGQNYQVKMKNCFDYGPFVGSGGTQLRRSSQSGYMNAIKVHAENESFIDGFYSTRPDGGIIVLSFNTSSTLGATFRNMRFTTNTSIPTWDANSNPALVSGWQWGGSNPFVNVYCDNIVCNELAPSPTNPPFGTCGQANSYNVVMRNITQTVVDWPTSGYPEVAFNGNNIHFEGTFIMTTHSSTTTYRGVVFTQLTGINTNSSFEVKVTGWRLWPLTFSNPLPVDATGLLDSSGNTLALATAWAYPTGTYQIVFSDTEVRYLTLTNSSTAITAPWTSALFNQVALTNSSILPAAGHTIQGVLQLSGQRSSYEMRNGVQYPSNGVQVKLRDLTNNIVYDFDNNSIGRTQTTYMSFTPPAGTAAFTTNIGLVQGDSVDLVTTYVSGTVMNSGSYFSVGYSGSPSLFIPSAAGTNTVTASMNRGNSTGTVWSNSTAYSIGNIVNLSGITYTCISGNTGNMPPNSTYWVLTTPYPPYLTSQGFITVTPVGAAAWTGTGTLTISARMISSYQGS